MSCSDINVALDSLKNGTSCGVDGLAAEHFMFAHRITHVFLSLLFNAYIFHGYLPADFMRTAMVSIINRIYARRTRSFFYRASIRSSNSACMNKSNLTAEKIV